MSEQLLNIKFVSEVKKYPCLYNYKMKEYSKKEITETAWAEVGLATNLTVLQAKQRWKNLRSVFVRNLKPLPSGSSKRKKYYLTDAMQFAIPFIKATGIISGSSSNVDQTEDVQNDDSDAQEIYQSVSLPSPSQSDTSLTQDSSFTLQPALACYSPSPSPVSFQHSKKKYKSTSSEFNERFDDYLKFKMSETDDNSTSTANKMFLLSLLPDLNSMSPAQIRTFKRETLLLIDNIVTSPSNTSISQAPSVNRDQSSCSKDPANHSAFIRSSNSRESIENYENHSQDPLKVEENGESW